MSGIGTRLRQERRRLGLSQREMGQMGGVAVNAQGKYESGERIPKADYLAALACVGVDVLYVLTSRHSPASPADSAQVRIDSPGEPDALLIQVQHAARHFMSTIQELSNSYVVNGKAVPVRSNEGNN
ncbi:helix-turn-helix domain-containing protein [Pseudomonas syringae]|uniref:DNA-binding protein n=1 Tax=Pseudomonas syringae TaxID=317 RepID=A0A085VN08_PSESX|nr:helix-turn-helix transcriptional regulator [Pseudomonas syringae]KFE56821.1 DNA-binding protein [Pseudomonas syringae]